MRPMNRRAQHPATLPVAPNMIAVASGKGGVGKTWFSVTLSQHLAQMGHKPLLFDGDIGLANIDIQLGLMPDVDLGSVVAGHSNLKDAITPYPEGGFDVIAGKSGSGALATLKKSRLTEMRDELVTLTNDYDKVIVDLGAGLEPIVQIMTASSGVILIVTTDEPTSITDAYAVIKVVARRNPKADIRIVVNMVDAKRDGIRTYQTLQKACQVFLKIDPKLAGVIRRDTKVKDSIRHQMSILSRHPTSGAGNDVSNIVKGLLEPK